MATKKLKVELELETAKAKRQAKEFEQTAGSGGGSSSAQGGKKLAESLDKAARSAEKSAGAFDKMSGTSARLTRGFAGIAVGMATSYAANYATGKTKNALEYGGSGISGAVSGAMMAGLPGAIAGGLAGVIKTYMDKNNEASKMTEDFRKANDTYEEGRLWQAKVEKMTDVGYSDVSLKGQDLTKDRIAKVDEKLSEANKAAEELFDKQNGLEDTIRKLLKKQADLRKKFSDLSEEDQKTLEKATEDLSKVRARKEQAESIEKSFAKQKKSLEHQLEQEKYDEAQKKNNDRGGFSAADSLGKLGIAFAGEGFAVPASGDSTQAPSSKPKALSSGFGFGFSVPVTPSVTHEFSAAAEGLVDPVDKIVDERLKQINEDQLKVLQDIAANTKERGITWQ